MSSTSSTDLTPTSSLLEVETPPSSAVLYDVEAAECSKEDWISRWRPSYHLQPAIPSWMNDPCAPFYYRKTGLYYVSFQWNPNGPDWGDISWGTATSPDMIHWTIQDTPSLSPDQPFDHKGVFTGCFMPSNDDILTYAYTSVSQLPIHHTLPHPKGCESLSLSVSSDGGKTWSKSDCNPILPCEPEELDVTGWRDPFVSKWPSMARMLGLGRDTSFGIISGGIRNKTPTTFLYAIDAADLTNWRYLGPIADFGINFNPSRWSGDLGRNWEVSNFLTLNGSTGERNIVICGAEGCISEERPGSGSPGPSRPSRQQLWFASDLQATNESQGHMGAAEVKYKFGGHLDHGSLYAANSFLDPNTDKHIVWGWIGEEDLSDDLRHLQGWSGMLSMPRELRLMTIQHVIGAAVSDLQSITSVEIETNSNGSCTLQTLASQPYQPLIKCLRSKPGIRRKEIHNAQLITGAHNISFDAESVQTTQWELHAVFDVSKQVQTIGISIAHSADYSRTTTLLFDQPSETFIINRPQFPGTINSSELINSSPEIAAHTLFYTQDPMSNVAEKEKLHIRAWRDNSVLEVFVNERTAISTRLYAAEETFGMSFLLEDQVLPITESEKSSLISATLWDGIGL